MNNNHSKVFLIGGAPGAGKTTLGSALAAKLSVTSLSVDDLVTASMAVTTPESHPGLHVMRKVPYIEYFTNSSIEQLKADATLRHEASYPLVERVIRKYARRESGIVIDGWHLRPSWVSQLNIGNIWAGWIVTTDDVLKARERKNEKFFQDSPNPEQMFEKFLERSLWYNNLIKEQATELQMNVLFQDGKTSVDELCRMILENSTTILK